MVRVRGSNIESITVGLSGIEIKTGHGNYNVTITNQKRPLTSIDKKLIELAMDACANDFNIQREVFVMQQTNNALSKEQRKYLKRIISTFSTANKQ